MSNTLKMGVILLLLSGCTYKNHLYRNTLLYSHYSYSIQNRTGVINEEPTVILIANKSRHSNDGFISINDEPETIYHFSNSECLRNTCTWYSTNKNVQMTYNYRSGMVMVDSIRKQRKRVLTLVIDSTTLDYEWIRKTPEVPGVLQDSINITYTGF